MVRVCQRIRRRFHATHEQIFSSGATVTERALASSGRHSRRDFSRRAFTSRFKNVETSQIGVVGSARDVFAVASNATLKLVKDGVFFV